MVWVKIKYLLLIWSWCIYYNSLQLQIKFLDSSKSSRTSKKSSSFHTKHFRPLWPGTSSQHPQRLFVSWTHFQVMKQPTGLLLEDNLDRWHNLSVYLSNKGWEKTTPVHPIFPTFPPPLWSPPRMWRSVFGDPQLPLRAQVKQNYWGMSLCSMAGPVGLSMGALPLHWQPEDFHFEGGRGLRAPSRQTFPYNSQSLCSADRHRGAVSQFNDVYVWGTSQDLARLSLVETLCFCDCRPSSSIKAALNAFLPPIPLKLHIGSLKTVCRAPSGYYKPVFANTSSEKKKKLGKESWHFAMQLFFLDASSHNTFNSNWSLMLWMLTSWKCRTIGLSDVFFPFSILLCLPIGSS